MSTVHTVEISGYAYHPEKLQIKVGDKVKWVNRDTVRHTATRTDAPAFDTGLLSKNQESAEVAFDTASDDNGFAYLCTPHPKDMRAVVVVQAR
jgi:plastocyanin